MEVTLELTEEEFAGLRRLARKNGFGEVSLFTQSILRDLLDADRIERLTSERNRTLRESTYASHENHVPPLNLNGPKLQRMRVPAGWRIVDNTFTDFDPAHRPNQDWYLSEDLLYAVNDRANVAIDLGWSGDVTTGGFRLQAMRMIDAVPDWGHPERELSTRDIGEVVTTIEEWFEAY